MACEYFVNGDWITENELKEILQGGLLDNLISNGTLDLKGFKIDSAKVIKTEAVEKKRKNIPANKLANILAQEIKTRQGYSPNMLSALELTPDGQDFKIPLWSSPYANKFESLLTSLVSNKIVKQKFPGNSYVLGSEEGFRIKEGDEAAGELKNSGIVFSDAFNPKKGLQPMRYDPATKKILPAQIMIPFKFRDEDGMILNLKNFTVKGEDGRMLLDTTKLPKKLLQLFGFRIPTQERNSMAAVEIVGFLPEASGDLMLAPRDFTKQMGSDFDVDKLYTYMYNHFYKDGKLQTGFMSDKKKIAASLKIQKEHLEDIKDELKLSKENRKLIDNYIKEKTEYNEEGEEIPSEIATKASEVISEILSKEINKELAKALDDTFNTISILKRSYKAVRQNNILDIHLQIMTSNNPEIIASIIALDSFGEFEEFAKDIDVARNGNKGMPNILSETYQRTKFINATAGKNGVGSFSLDSTFNATAQGKEIVLERLDEESRIALFGTIAKPKAAPTAEEVLAANSPIATFGDIMSKGDLSNKYTLRSQEIIAKAKLEKRELTAKEQKSIKFKSSIIRALQSTAVDNEKAQILDKLNINDETFDAIRALTLLGFEEKEIVGLITQEIVWEYIEKLRNSNSSLTSYNPNAASDIFDQLALKYDPSSTFVGLEPDRIDKLASKSGEDLIENIKTKKLIPLSAGIAPDYNLEQLALLKKFQDLTAVGKDIKVLQSTINTESSGIPKSLIETENKIEQIQRLPYLNIFNANKLLGEFEEGDLATPTTINGYAAYYGAMFANQIFDKYFPYKTTGFRLIADEVMEHMPKKIKMSSTKKAEIQSEVFEAMRSYLYANTDTNLFGENPDVERRRLFIDSKGTATKKANQSLATILQELSTKSWYQKNGFLNKLSFDINKNGTISRINFEAAAGENFDERNIYDGFNYLLSKNFSLGNFNGIDYTSRMLAQELVAAAMLEGGAQGSKQYLKYVPIAYLKSMGFGEYLQGIPFDFQSTFFGNMGVNGTVYFHPSVFTRQYFQNNPEITKTVSLSDLQGNIVATPEGHFTLNKEALTNNFVDTTDPFTGDSIKQQVHFLSIYDNKLPSKYALFEFDSVDRLYRRIPVLSGSYGFVSYNSENKTAMPIEAKNIITSTPPQLGAPGYTLPKIPTEPSVTFNVDVVNNSTVPRTTAVLPIDRTLNGTKEALDDLLNNLETADEVSTLNRQLLQLIRGLELPENFKVTYNKTEGRGSYDSDKAILNINLESSKNQEINDLATVTAHELIHALTASSIRAYQDGNIKGLSARTIAAIQQLENLQKLYIDQLVAKEGEEGLNKFKELYFNWKQGKTSMPSISKKDISKYYGAIKLTEFVTMALTDIGFQEHLNSITDESGVSLWEQLKELLSELLNALGLDIKPGSALASAVKDTMDLIQANQEALRENNIETKEFLEFGNSYKFQVDGSGKVIKAEYAQGRGMFKDMNAKNGQKKYDELKNKPELISINAPQPTQPSTINTLPENIKNFVNSVIPNWIDNKNNELQLVSEFKTIQLLVQEESSIKDRISFGEEAETLIKEGLRGKDVFVGTTFKEQIPNLLYAVISGKLAKDGISEADMYSNIFKNTTQPVTSVKEGVTQLFEANPELANIGTPEQYSAYLDTIFPDSQVKDIVYHGTTRDFENFLDEKKGEASGLTDIEDSKGNIIGKADSNFAFFFTDVISNTAQYQVLEQVEANKEIRSIISTIKSFGLNKIDLDRLHTISPDIYNKIIELKKDPDSLSKYLDKIQSEYNIRNDKGASMASRLTNLLTQKQYLKLLKTDKEKILKSSDVTFMIPSENDMLIIDKGQINYYNGNNSFLQSIKSKNLKDLTLEQYNNLLSFLTQETINFQKIVDDAIKGAMLTPKLMSVIINLTNTVEKDFNGADFITSESEAIGVEASKLTEKAFKEGKDGVIFKNIKDPVLANNYGVFTAKQIHTLGSQEDIKGFKEFVTQPSTGVKPTIDTSREWSGDLKTRPVYTPEGVNTMRTEVAKKDEHFGNPFSEAGYGNTRKVPTIQTAVQAYKDWLLTGYATWLDESGEAEDFAGNQEQRKWILDQINQGKLDSAILLYAGKSAARGQGMHPTALAEVVEELRTIQPTTKTSAQKTEDKLNLEIESINKKYEIFPGVFANAGQTEALDKMTNFLAGQDKAFLLKGRGGTGKTTIVKMVIDKSNIPHSQILGATVADEARGILANNLPATVKTRTIAGALGLVADFNSRTGEIYFRERNTLEQGLFDAKGKSDPIEGAKLIIIDEASMIGDDIYEILMRKKSPFAKVIFMGDNAQIPPIMADGSSKDSPVFKLLEGTENFAELTQRMRQGEESPILPVTDVYAENIESMQRGDQGKENPLTKRTSSFDVNSNSGVIFTDNRQEIVDGFVEDFQKDPDNLKNAVIIGARNEVVDNFAQLVRNKLFDNPSEPFVIGDIIRVNSPFLEGKEVIYANGFKGKVIKVEPLGINPLINLETFAITVEYDSVDISGKTVGKTTRMTTINPENKKALKSMLQALALKAKSKQINWKVYYDIKESIVDLGYNYAMTSHKVQGSTYKNVYVLEDDIMSFPGGRLQRNRMLYTAVSRPTTKLVLFSTKNTSATIQKSTGLDLSRLSGDIENYQSIPTSSYGEEGDRMSNRPSDDDWDAYNRAMNTDELLPDSPISSDNLRNYLLICGK